MSNSRRQRWFRDILLTTTALVAALAGGGKTVSAGSAPATNNGLSGFGVVSGGATLSTPSPTKSVITQTTNKAIITWSAFGIPLGDTVQFIQPGSSSVALNRVTGGNVTNIMGSLLANGQVWIVNPAGVFFGPGAQVDVAGLMATTADIKNGDFLSGNYQFGIGSSNPNASIVNQGTIRTTNGSTVLVGAQVTNQGLIAAQMGQVVLGGASTFAVDFQGDKLLSFQVTSPVSQSPSNGDALVTNSGTITATGGTVLLTARAAKGVIDNVINSTGIVEATSAKSVNGEIVLDGGDTGQVSVSGTLDASGKGAGETGGTVKVLGDQISLAAGANIDVSGDAGGGTALVGGNFHGAGPEQNASTTTVSAGSQINASALTSGNGGKVAIWSDTHTTFAGTVTATGGSLGGNGGLIETSAKSLLTITQSALVSAAAAKGVAGSWLLDPSTITLGGSSISAAVIGQDLSAGTNVVIDAPDGISVQGNITDTGSTGVALTLATDTSPSSNSVITFADNKSIASTDGPLSINLLAGGSGSIVMGTGSALITQGGDVFSNKSMILGTAGNSVGSVSIITTRAAGSGAVTLAGTVDDFTGASVGLTVNGGSVSVAGSIGSVTPIAALQLTGTAITLGGSVVHATGSETISGPLTLVADETLTSNTGGITLGGPVDGAFELSLAASSGNISLGNVGASTPLSSLLVDPATVVLNGTTYDTSGDQTYSAGVTLGANATLVSTAGNIGFVAAIDGPFALSATASSGTLSVGGLIGGQTALSNVDASGKVVALDGIDHSGAVGATGTISITGSTLITLDGSAYHSGGSESFSGPVTLLHDETLTSDSGDIRFSGTTSTINGAFALALTAASSTGTVSLGGSAGGVTELTSLLIDPATIALGGSTYHTSRGQTYVAGVSLGADATLISDQGNVVFLSSVDGGHSLGVSAASGAASFGGAVGFGTELTSFVVSAASISLGGSGGSVVHSSGGESFSGPVTLQHDETVTSDSSTITFSSTVDGAFGLTAAAAATTFDGSVGSGTALASLTVTHAADLNGGSVTTTGTQDYQGPVVLTTNDLLTGSVITFQSTVDGAFGLTAAAAATTFDGSVGSGTALASLTVTHTADLNGGSVSATGAQDYQGPVVLTTNDLLAGSVITFESTVDGAFGLTAAAAATTFDGSVGSGTALASLTVTHTADLNGGSVSATGAQDYQGPVVLTTNDLLAGSVITFESTVDGGHALTATATGLTTFDGAVGGTTPLASLTVTNAADLNGGTITTSGAQNYDSAVTLSANALLTASSVIFHGTVEGAFALTATATGPTAFDGAVGGTTPLASLTVTNAADLNGSTITTSGAQNYDGAVTLSANALLTASSVIFQGTVDGAFALRATATGHTTFDGAVGGTTPLASLTVTHTTDLNGGSVTTTGAQDYQGPVVLTTNDLLTGSVITFASKVDGAFGLTAAAAVTTFDGSVGSGTALASLTVTHAADLNGGSITTTGTQSYGGPATLSEDATLTSTSGNIAFASTVDGAFNLTAAAAATTFDGSLGSGTALASLTVTHASDLNGGTITTAGAQNYDGAVTLGANALLAASSVIFHSTVDGAFALTATATGLTTFDGAVGETTPLTSLTVTHTSDLNGGSITTTGAQDYQGPVALTTNDLLTGSVITFQSTVDGAFGLTAAAAATFDGSVGSGTALASLTVTHAADLNGGSVTTTGAQDYQGPVVLTTNDLLTGSVITFASTVDGAFGLTAAAAATTFDGSVGSGTALASLTVTHAADLNGGSVTTTGTQSYGGPATLSEDATLTSTSGNIAFASTVDGAFSLTATANAGTVSVGALVGSASALSALALSGSTVALSGIDHSGSAGVAGGVSVTASSAIDLGGAAYHSGGDESWIGPVVLLHDETVTSDTGGIAFRGPINGAHALSIFATSGVVTLGAVGTTQALTTMLVDPAGILLDGTLYHTTGNQSYLQPVTLGVNATFTSNTGNVTFGGTVDGAHALSVAASSGSIGFGNVVGATSALASLTLNASTVTLSGFGNTGNAGVTGAVAVTATGTIIANGATYHSGGSQRWAGPVVLGADETFISDESDVTFTSTVNGGHVLSASANSGSIDVGGDIGGGTPLAKLTLDAKTVTLTGIDHSGSAGVSQTVAVNGSSLITLEGAAYHAGGDQNYTGSVALAGNSTIISDTGNITFNGPVNGTSTLSIAAGSGTVSLGNVGATTKLAALLVDPAAIDLEGTAYRTTGNQIYSAAVTLGADAAVSSDTGNVTFATTIDGAHVLSVTASAGTVGVSGVVGSVTALTSLAINGADDVQVTSVHTDGSQSYTSGHTITISGIYDTGSGPFTANGAVNLAGVTTINPGSGPLAISGALTGNANLDVLGSGADTSVSINLDSGTLDLSGKTGGSFTVNGVADAAALVTGSNNYSLAFLGGGNIGDPTLANTGGDTLAGSFIFANGLTIPSTLTLAGNTTLDTETSGITLGSVQQGTATFIVIADAVTLNGPWTGTGPRGLTPFSNSLSIGLGDGATGSWTLNSQELQYIADPPQFVVIGAGTSIGQEIQDIGGSNTAFVPASGPGPINVGTFSFDAPLYLIGSSIALDGTLTKNTGGVGFITPGSIAGPGSLDLGPGTGILAIFANSADLNGTVNGSGGNSAAGETVLVGTPGTGPYTINGICFAGSDCGTSTPPPPAGPNIALLGSTVLYSNQLNTSQDGLAPPGGSSEGPTNGPDTLANISPSSGGPNGDTSAPTDAAVDALSGPLEAKPPTQAQPRVQGNYISLLGGMLFEWREPSSTSTSNTTPDENTEFSGWGNEARW